MGMPDTLRWTADMVRALPDDGNRYELVDGVLIVTPAPSMPHQRAVSALNAALLPYLQAVGIGYIFFPRMELSFGEDELLEPDLCVAPREKALAAQHWPDLDEMLLVVEVLSPSTRPAHRLRKRKRYQRARVPDYWVIDLDQGRVERWRPGTEQPEILTGRVVWQPAGARQPLEIDLTALFREAIGTTSGAGGGFEGG